MSKIIHISEAFSIAIHSMALIAQSAEKINVNIIAEKTHSSKTHLAKVMQQLVKNNFLESERGPKGGFILKKPANEISLLEIYELIEGIPENHPCGIPSGKCPFKTCVFGGMTEKLSKEFIDYLSNRKLSEIL